MRVHSISLNYAWVCLSLFSNLVRFTKIFLFSLLFHRCNNPLESEPLEEIVRSSSLLLASNLLLVQVTILENLLQVLLNLNLLVTNKISLIDSLLQIHIDLVTGGEDVTDIDVLDEGLHGPGALLDLLLGHAAGDLAGTTGDTSNEAVGELLAVSVSVLDVLDDDGLLTGVTSGKDDDYFS